MGTIYEIAKEFARLASESSEPDPLTALRLQKLLWYAQAWSLVVRDRNLFRDDFHAGTKGPVVPDVLHSLDRGRDPIWPENIPGEVWLSDEEKRFVGAVWSHYGQFSASRLSEMAQAEPPWRKAWPGKPADAREGEVIPVGEIREWFRQQPIPAPIQRHAELLRTLEAEAEQRLAAREFDPSAFAAMVRKSAGKA